MTVTILQGHNAIPVEWIKQYVDQLHRVAAKLEPRTMLHQTMMLRALHATDLVEAWKEHADRGEARGDTEVST